jgi:type I restriction-modification system DNA methylase subunit
MNLLPINGNIFYASSMFSDKLFTHHKHTTATTGRVVNSNAEGKKGGQFYTPKAIVKLMVEMIEPYKGRVYDPASGSGGMFVM